MNLRAASARSEVRRGIKPELPNKALHCRRTLKVAWRKILQICRKDAKIYKNAIAYLAVADSGRGALRGQNGVKPFCLTLYRLLCPVRKGGCGVLGQAALRPAAVRCAGGAPGHAVGCCGVLGQAALRLAAVRSAGGAPGHAVGCCGVLGERQFQRR
jgi:hypothetical protein